MGHQKCVCTGVFFVPLLPIRLSPSVTSFILTRLQALSGCMFTNLSFFLWSGFKFVSGVTVSFLFIARIRMLAGLFFVSCILDLARHT